MLKFILFADDTTILFSANSLHDLTSIVNTELCYVSDWFKANKLSLNISKTNYIIFNKRAAADLTFTINFDNSPIVKVSTTKFLGVEIDEDLNWKDHIRKIEKKLLVLWVLLAKKEVN